MIRFLLLADTPVFVSRFNDEELAMRQIEAQRHAVKRIAATLWGPDTIIDHHPDGAPFIPGLAREISISHCRGCVALAVGGTSRLGIDIEEPRPTLTRVVSKFLSPDEITRYTSLDDLLWAWTYKEAAYKAAGTPGLSLTDIQLPAARASSTTETIILPPYCLTIVRQDNKF